MKKTLALLLLLSGLTLDAQAETLTWNGSTDHMTWNTEETNWLSGETHVQYTDASAVEFGDNGSGEVMLDGTLTPASVLVNSSQDYTFSGEGKLSGDMQLTKSGSGTLTINTANDYKEGTIINKGGVLVMGNANALGTGLVTLNGGNLNLNWKTLSSNVKAEDGSRIGNGKFHGTLTVADKATLTISGQMDGSGTIILGDGASLYLEETLSNKVELSGSSAYMGGPNYAFRGNLSLGSGQTLTLSSDLQGMTAFIILDDNATLDLGNHNLYDMHVYVAGNNATIRNGEYYGNLNVTKDVTLTLPKEGLTLSKIIILDDNATLDLGGGSFSTTISLGGSPSCTASIGNGTITTALDVGAGKTLNLCGDLNGTGTVKLYNNATVNLCKHTLSNNLELAEATATIGNGTLNGNLTVDSDKTLKLSGNLTGTGTIALKANATLDLGGHTLASRLDLNADASGGSAIIGNGTIEGTIHVPLGRELTLLANTSITGEITLNNNTTLDLGGNTFHVGGEDGNKITLDNDISGISIGNGTLDGNLEMKEGQTLTLCGNLRGTGTINMATGSALNLASHTLSKNVTAEGSATITAGHTTIKALDNEHPGLLQELSVSDGLIAGTDRLSSLADGLEITSESDLMIKSMTLTPNNKISVGDHTITLQDVTIKLSRYTYDGPEGIFSFDLKSLINCDLKMENVLLDASELTLPEGFDPAKVAVVFDFGDDVSIKQATGLDMRLGNYWSPSMNLDEQGKVVFTALVPTPEPTTGTLSLLALAALAARRRRK